jgi:hypothetical protein
MTNRPTSLFNITERVRTGHTTMFVTVTYWNGEPYEVFTKVRGSDSCEQGYLEALTRSISLGLQAGVPVEEYIEHLGGIACVPSTDQDNGGFVKSPADAISKVLKHHIQSIRDTKEVVDKSSGNESSEV